MSAKRPTPEEMLDLIKQEEEENKDGKLKIFLGAAPGVGKTYSMLKVALEKKAEGVDIVAGFVETHNRQDTLQLLTPLEKLPLKTIDYYGKRLNEFDLDAAISRKPTIILVDELAHTNATGSRHAKRWQDVKELLDLGIDVYTTLNVQHIESLNDVIAQITGVKVRETVPDLMIEIAEDLELVDLPPDDLLMRLKEGKIYLPSQAELASNNFFKKGNLSALRELALRMTAEFVNTEVTLHRQGQAIKKTWPTTERLLVCVGTDPETVKLIRSAKRLATNLKADWIAVFVDSPKINSNSIKRENALKALRLAESLGAEAQLLTGTDVVKTIVNLAHERNISKIIVGKVIRPRWIDLTRKTLVEEIIRHSEEIDVYIVKHQTDSTTPAPSTPEHRPKFTWSSYINAVIIWGICTAINFSIYSLFPHTDFDFGIYILIYLIGIIIISNQGERVPAFISSLLSIGVLAFFFGSPSFRWDFIRIQYLFSLLTMFGVSQFISHLATLRKKQENLSHFQEKRLVSLYNLSKKLANTRGIENLLGSAIRYVGEIFNSRVSIFLPEKAGHLYVHHGDFTKLEIGEKERSIALWVYNLGQRAGIGTETLSHSKAIYLPLKDAQRTIGVIRVQPKDPKALLVPEQFHLLEALTNQIALAIAVETLHEKKK